MLAELIEANQPCVALTGAGASTESGIPDFRSAGGIWAQYDPLEVASIDGFRRDPARACGSSTAGGSTSSPPRARTPRTSRSPQLEERGLLDAVITQNVDGLHTRAGSRDVIEVHGSIATASCPAVRPRAWTGRACASCSRCRAARVRHRAQARRRAVRRAAAGGRRSTARPRSRRERRCCSSSAPRSRCGRSPGCRPRRSSTAARSRSSTATRRRTTGGPASSSVPAGGRGAGRLRGCAVSEPGSGRRRRPGPCRAAS